MTTGSAPRQRPNGRAVLTFACVCACDPAPASQISGWVSVSYCAHPRELPRSTMFSSTSSAVPPTHVRAYHTLLLRNSSADLKRRLIADCSPALRRLVECATPLKTLQDLAEDIDVSLSQMLRMAVHLVAWHGGAALSTHTRCACIASLALSIGSAAQICHDIPCSFSLPPFSAHQSHQRAKLYTPFAERASLWSRATWTGCCCRRPRGMSSPMRSQSTPFPSPSTAFHGHGR